MSAEADARKRQETIEAAVCAKDSVESGKRMLVHLAEYLKPMLGRTTLPRLADLECVWDADSHRALGSYLHLPGFELVKGDCASQGFFLANKGMREGEGTARQIWGLTRNCVWLAATLRLRRIDQRPDRHWEYPVSICIRMATGLPGLEAMMEAAGVNVVEVSDLLVRGVHACAQRSREHCDQIEDADTFVRFLGEFIQVAHHGI